MGKSGTTTTLRGTRGDDIFTIPGNLLITQVVIDGGAGRDTLDLSSYGSGVTALLEGGLAKSSSTVANKEFTGLWGNYTLAGAATAKGTIKGVESLIGTDYNDFLFINLPSTAKYIDAGGGNDVVNSLGGNAVLVGGSGSDWLVGYWQNVTLIGGTWNGSTATADGEKDYFVAGSQCPVILDFEVGIDQLICEPSGWSMSDLGSLQWVSNGAGGSTLMIGGVAEVTLANVGLSLAQSIEIGHSISPVNGVVEGQSGDDLLYVGSIVPSRIILGADNGDDATIGFDILTDVLVFEDGVVPTWSNSLVNGAPALLGSWAGGSITLQGLSTDDVANLIIEGSAGSIGSDGPGPWSTSSDYAAASTLIEAGMAEAHSASLVLMAG